MNRAPSMASRPGCRRHRVRSLGSPRPAASRRRKTRAPRCRVTDAPRRGGRATRSTTYPAEVRRLRHPGTSAPRIRSSRPIVPDCLREGFVAENMVDIQSNNAYRNGFCIHSNDVVSLNSNNYFEAKAPWCRCRIQSRLDMPASGYSTSNEGLHPGAALWRDPDPADQRPARGAVHALRHGGRGDVELHPAGHAATGSWPMSPPRLGRSPS
jgi:hypothetical protein